MNNLKPISYYFEEYKKSFSINAHHKNCKVALLSSFTTKGLKEILAVKGWEMGLNVDTFMGGYNQYFQEIMDEQSQLYSFNPDLVILFIDTRALLGDLFYNFYELNTKEREELLSSKKQDLNCLITTLKSKVKSKIIVHNFEIPSHSYLGILESKQKLGKIEFIEKINQWLRDDHKTDAQVFIFDYNGFISHIGKKEIFDYKMYYLADTKLSFDYFSLLADKYFSYLKPLMSITKKCLVLDLDNTLWGGIIGEDGVAGIKLGPTPEGRPFLEFQRYILSLFNRGVILAINSKNNYDDVLKVFNEHPHMILKENHFASIQINWNDKISNMKTIAQEINIGLDSFIFFDDDKLNREMIKDALPEIKVVDLPEDYSLYLKTIEELDDFNTFQLTEEDKKKGKMYADQRKRSGFIKSIQDVTEYLKGLQMKITIEEANKFNIPRISQLTQKTNQFNMTTRRYLEEDIQNFLIDDNILLFSIRVEDKFGDNGTTGVAIIEKSKECFKINTFLLSCRIIGRKVEETMLAYILEKAKQENVEKLVGNFIPTKKNIPARDFYKENGFNLIEDNEDNENIERWEFPVEKEYKAPGFVEVIIKND